MEYLMAFPWFVSLHSSIEKGAVRKMYAALDKTFATVQTMSRLLSTGETLFGASIGFRLPLHPRRRLRLFPESLEVLFIGGALQEFQKALPAPLVHFSETCARLRLYPVPAESAKKAL